jgi:hypothetical protein
MGAGTLCLCVVCTLPANEDNAADATTRAEAMSLIMAGR